MRHCRYPRHWRRLRRWRPRSRCCACRWAGRGDGPDSSSSGCSWSSWWRPATDWQPDPRIVIVTALLAAALRAVRVCCSPSGVCYDWVGAALAYGVVALAYAAQCAPRPSALWPSPCCAASCSGGGISCGHASAADAATPRMTSCANGSRLSRMVIDSSYRALHMAIKLPQFGAT